MAAALGVVGGEGCAVVAPVVVVAAPQTAPVPAALTLHVDDAFSPGERNLIEAAVVSLNVQSHGLLSVRTVSGLDTASFRIPPGDWRLMRIGDTDDLTHRFDHRNSRGVPDPIVGICVRYDHSLYLVPDRIRTSAQLLSVTMHEILHAVGMEHGGGRRAVMHPVVVDDAPVRLSDADLSALSTVLRPTLPHRR